MMNMLESYLSSNESLPLDNSFKIVFKVLSVSHVKHNILNKPNYVPHKHKSEIPGSDSREKKYPDFVISFPTHCGLHQKDCFRDECFSLTMQFVIARKKFKEKGISNSYFEFVSFKSSQSPSSSRHMHEQLQKFQKDTQNLDFKGKLQFISSKFQVQFHFFDADQDFKFIESFPSIFSFEYCQIHLCYFNDQKHITVFSDYNAFCAKKKQYFCFACTKYFVRKTSSFHRCHKQDTCFACCRPLAKENYYDFSSIAFCDSNIAKPFQVIYDHCAKCNITFTTKNCKNNHFRVCQRGVKFDCCGHFIYKAEGLSSHDSLKKNHICSEKKCNFCHAHLHENVGDAHQCNMKKYEIPEKYPTLGFFHFLKENPSGVNCYTCHKMGTCEIHSSKQRLEYSPAVCTLYVPKSKDSFEISIFTKFNISLPKKKTIFLSSDQFFSPCSSQLSPHDFSELKAKDPETLEILDQIAHFILSDKVFGVTFLTFCPEGFSMIFVLDMLLSIGLTPKVINRHNAILFIDVPELQLKFLNLTNFLPFATSSEFVSNFFPENIISMRSVLRNVRPNVEDFFSFSDSLDLIEKKRAFFKKLDVSYWDFFREMILYSESFVNEIICQTNQFLNEARAFQKLAFSQYCKEFKFLHPFKDSVTKNGYIFKLFLYLDLNYRPIFAIPREYTGIFDRVSKKEVQFVQYLMTNNPEDTFVHAFSPYGQKRFKTSVGVTIPDAINVPKKVAYYFHGCFYHSHDPKICHLNKKGCHELSRKKQEVFNAKKLCLLDEFDEISAVVIEWECVWDGRKRDGETGNFLKRKFINRPLRRLVPRKACEYLRYCAFPYYSELPAIIVFNFSHVCLD